MNTSKKICSKFPVWFSWRFWLLGWIPFIAYNLFVITGAVTPAPHIPKIFTVFNDKLVHGSEFFLLFLFAVNAMKRTLADRPQLFALGHCVMMGLLTECLQFYVPSRSPEIADFLADTAGACFAAFLFGRFFRKKNEVP